MSLSTGEIFFSLFQTLYRQHYGVSCPHIFLHPIKQKRRERFPWGWHNSFWERSPSSCFNMSNSALPWLQWVCLSLQMETLIYCCSYTHSHMHTLFLGNICFSAITWMQTAWLRKCSRMSMQRRLQMCQSWLWLTACSFYCQWCVFKGKWKVEDPSYLQGFLVTGWEWHSAESCSAGFWDLRNCGDYEKQKITASPSFPDCLWVQLTTKFLKNCRQTCKICWHLSEAFLCNVCSISQSIWTSPSKLSMSASHSSVLFPTMCSVIRREMHQHSAKFKPPLAK